jgi:polyisoprenoid-binding protein YceI
MSTAATPQSATSLWRIDPVHSTAQFKVKHMMISNVKGEFTSLSGDLQVDLDDLTRSKIEASIDAASINTRDVQRDAHLKSPDFLDVENFPRLTFVSTGVSKRSDSDFAVTGDLSIHGVTRKVTFDFEELSAPQRDPWGNQRIGLSGTTKINRKDYGLTWNTALETGGFLVGDEVTITLDVQFVKS